MENDRQELPFLCEFLGFCSSAFQVSVLGCGGASLCDWNHPVMQCHTLEEWSWYFLLWIASCWLAVIFRVISALSVICRFKLSFAFKTLCLCHIVVFWVKTLCFLNYLCYLYLCICVTSVNCDMNNKRRCSALYHIGNFWMLAFKKGKVGLYMLAGGATFCILVF